MNLSDSFSRVSCLHHCMNFAFPINGVLLLSAVLLLSIPSLTEFSYAEEGATPEERSLADELKDIAKDPEILIEGVEGMVERTYSTIKKPGKTSPDSPEIISENIEHAVDETESLVQDPQSETSVEGEIESRDEIARDPTANSIYPQAYYQLRKITKDWERRLGLEITFSYDVVGQQYFDDVESEGGLAGDVSMSGRWLLFGHRKDLPVYLTFRLRNRHAIADKAPSTIGPDTGLFWKTVSGFNDSGFQIPDMYFSQELSKRKVVLRYGQLGIDNFFDSHRFRSAKRYFLNFAFSDNPSINFPKYGAGLVLQWNPNERWELIGGGSNIQGTSQNDIDFGIDSTALFKSGQVRYQFAGDDERSSELRVMVWHSDSLADEDLAEDKGISVTVGIDGPSKGEEFAFRFAASGGDATAADVLYFAGYGKEIGSYDHWGIGVAAGHSSESSDWQVTMETYYRWWVFKELMITPDLQLTLGDHLDRDTNVSVVAGLRLGFIF